MKNHKGHVTVESGDTLSEIADTLGVPLRLLQRFNNIKNANKIQAGAILRIPSLDDIQESLNSAPRSIAGKAREAGSRVVNFASSLKELLFGDEADSVRVSSHYGRRFHPLRHQWRTHSGIDLAAAAGTEIHAPADGTVVFAGRRGGYGNQVVLRHEDGTETTYSHLQRIPAGVLRGAKVAQDDVVGLVGMTGLATGPHLHFEVKKDGRVVNPLRSDFLASVMRGALPSRNAALLPELHAQPV